MYGCTEAYLNIRLKKPVSALFWCVVAAALVAATVLYPRTATAAEQMISREHYRSDLAEAYDLLKSYHPNLTAHTKRKDLNALYRRLRETPEEQVTIDEAYLAISELVGAVCDEHTQVIKSTRSSRPYGWPWYSYPLVVDDGKLYLEAPGTGSKEEILSIDDVPGPEIAAGLAARSPGDGCLGDGTLLVNQGLFLNGNIVSAMINNDAGFYIVRTLVEGSQRTLTRLIKATNRFVSASKHRRLQEEQRRNLGRDLLGENLYRQRLGPEVEKAGLIYRYSPRRNVAYVDIEQFDNYEKMEKAIDLVMRDIIEKNPDAVILDLVDNPGGSTRSAQLLMAFLLPRAHRLHSRVHMRNVSRTLPTNFAYFDEQAEKSRKYDVGFFRKVKPKSGVRSATVARKSFGKPDYKGPIYVLVSPGSRSNAIRVATNLKRLRKAKIVGSVTATDTTTYCSRANGNFQLEHTGFLLRIPEICYRSPENRFNDGHTLAPDIEVSPLDGELGMLNSMIAGAALEDIGGELTQ